MPAIMRDLIESMWPAAGVATARRNAWAAMAADAKRARQRAETAAYLDAVAAAHAAGAKAAAGG